MSTIATTSKKEHKQKQHSSLHQNGKSSCSGFLSSSHRGAVTTPEPEAPTPEVCSVLKETLRERLQGPREGTCDTKAMLTRHSITVGERLKPRTCRHHARQLPCVCLVTTCSWCLPDVLDAGDAEINHLCPAASQNAMLPGDRSHTAGGKCQQNQGQAPGSSRGRPSLYLGSPSLGCTSTPLAMNYQQGSGESLKVTAMRNRIHLRKIDWQLRMGQPEGETETSRKGRQLEGRGC